MATNQLELNKRLGHIKEVAKNRYLKCIFLHAPHHTIHDETHSENIQRHAKNFLHANPQITLNDYEDFLFKCCIWLHDIGMVRKEGENEDIGIIRKKHHIRSRDMIDSEEGRKIFNLNSLESNIVGTISFLHSRREDICKGAERHGIEGIVRATWGGKDFEIDLKKLGMLLRLLDTCDREHIRAYDIDTLLEEAKLPEAAMYHWAHSRINSVRFGDKTIELHCLVPPPAEGETKSIEETIVDTLIVNSIGKEIDSLAPVLEKYDIKDLNVKQVPQRTATDRAPQPIIEQYRNFVHSSNFLPIPGFVNRSIEKNVCILKNAHTIIDLTYNILVTNEKGINEIIHSFFADDSAVPNFKFRDFKTMKRKRVENRWEDFWFGFKIFNYNMSGELSLDTEELEGIESPLKAKFIKLIFSRTLEKGSEVKYGIAYSAPGLFDVIDRNKKMTSSLFAPRETNDISINLKFERGLIAGNFEFLISEAKSGVEKIRTNLNNLGVFLNSEEGEFSYCKDDSFYYTEHKVKIKYPKRDRRYTIQWRFLGDE